MWTIRLLTWGTLLVELSLAFLVWIQPWGLLAGVMPHLGIEWSMVLPLMELVMIAAYAAFLEESDVLPLLGAVDDAARRLGFGRLRLASM